MRIAEGVSLSDAARVVTAHLNSSGDGESLRCQVPRSIHALLLVDHTSHCSGSYAQQAELAALGCFSKRVLLNCAALDELNAFLHYRRCKLFLTSAYTYHGLILFVICDGVVLRPLYTLSGNPRSDTTWPCMLLFHQTFINKTVVSNAHI